MIPDSFIKQQKIKNSIKALACNFLGFDDRRLTEDSKHNRTLKELRERYAFLKPDKGNGVVLIKLSDYYSSMTSIFSDPTKFQKLEPKTPFFLNDQLYRQIDGVSMGSPLGPTLADILMTAFEDEIVRPLSSNVIKFYSRYVDDTLVLIKIRGSFWTTVFRENGKQILKQFIRKPFSMTTGKRF